MYLHCMACKLSFEEQQTSPTNLHQGFQGKVWPGGVGPFVYLSIDTASPQGQ